MEQNNFFNLDNINLDPAKSIKLPITTELSTTDIPKYKPLILMSFLSVFAKYYNIKYTKTQVIKIKKKRTVLAALYLFLLLFSDKNQRKYNQTKSIN